MALLLQDRGLAFGVVEEEGWEGVAGARVDDHAAEPPAETWGSDEQAVDRSDGDREGVMSNGTRVCCGCWRRGYEVGLLGRRVAFGEVNFDVCVEGVSKGVFGKPG